MRTVRNGLILAQLCAFALIAACGGGSGDPVTPTTPITPTTPTTPTVQPGPPATLTVVAGDAQLSEPGRDAAVRPSVTVKDAAGVLVPGAVVTFVVDSGGGSVAGATITTAADGIATLGSWTLGKQPARNVLRVTAGSAPAVRIAATTSWTGVTATLGEVGASGGTITLARPGSLLDKVSIVIPAGAFTAATKFSVLASGSGSVAAIRSAVATSASNPLRSIATSNDAANTRAKTVLNAATANTLTNIANPSLIGGPALPAAMLAVTPVITIVSNGALSAAQDLLISLPIPRGTSTNLVVAIVDSAANPVGYLSPVAMDTISVTVNLRGLDASVFTQQQAPNSSTPRSLSLVVFAGGDALTVPQLYPAVIKNTFTPTQDSWGAYDFPTSYFGHSSAGMVLTEWTAFGKYPGGIWGIGAYAPGVELSRSPLYMATAVMSEYVQQYYYTPANLAKWVAYRTRNNATYDRWTMTSTLAYLKYGLTIPFMLTDGTNMRMVLVYGWDPASESFMVLDHALPGFPTQLKFQNGKMLPYTDPWDASIKYTTPVNASSVAYEMYPTLYSTLVMMSNPVEPFSQQWKSTSLFTWGTQLLYGANRTIPDTLFMVDDSTRVWAGVGNAAVPINTTLPMVAGYRLQRADQHKRVGTAWQSQAFANATSLYIDARNGNPNLWFTQTYGFVVDSPRSLQDSVFSWHAWRQVDVVRFGLKININTNTVVNQPVIYSVTTTGGPALPAGATFEWNFNDGTAIEKTSAPNITHTYTEGGKKSLEVKVYHPKYSMVIAKQTVLPDVTGGVATWKFTNIGVQSVATGPVPFGSSNGLSYSWGFYSAIFNDIRSGAMEGGLIYLPNDTTFDGHFHEKGMYVVDGQPFNAKLVNTALDLSYAGNNFNWRVNHVRGTLLALARPSYRFADVAALDERYTETGTLTAGTIGGTTWEWVGPTRTTAGRTFTFPLFSRTGDIQFLGTTATGTLTYVVRNYTNDFTLAETSRYTLTVTFSAIRIQ